MKATSLRNSQQIMGLIILLIMKSRTSPMTILLIMRPNILVLFLNRLKVRSREILPVFMMAIFPQPTTGTTSHRSKAYMKVFTKARM